MCGLPGGGQLSSAAIVGHDGGVWAQSTGFPAISKTEVDALLRGLSDPSTLAMTGIVIGGEKARRARACVRPHAATPPLAVPNKQLASCSLRPSVCRSAAPPDAAPPPHRAPSHAHAQFFSIGGETGSVIRGKKGPGGCTIKKTVTALVVGIYSEGVTPGDCSVVVENLGDYLSGQGI
jgi:hypothetical protein